MWVTKHLQELREQPDPERLAASVKEFGAIGGEEQHSGILQNSEPQELHGLRDLGLQVITVGKGIIPLETIELDASVDVDQHVVVFKVILWCLEQSRVVLDALYSLEEMLQLAILVWLGGSGCVCDVADQLCSQGGWGDTAICSWLKGHIAAFISQEGME